MSHTRRRKATNGFAKKVLGEKMEIKRFPFLLSKPFGKRAKTWPKMEEAMFFRFAYQPLSLALSNRSKDFFFSEGAFPNLFFRFSKDKTREGNQDRPHHKSISLPSRTSWKAKKRKFSRIPRAERNVGKRRRRRENFLRFIPGGLEGRPRNFSSPLLSSSAHTRN